MTSKTFALITDFGFDFSVASMKPSETEIKLTFIPGLKEIVVKELELYPNISVLQEGDDYIYIDYIKGFSQLESLGSVLRVYLVTRDLKYTPRYLASHKSIIGNIISLIIGKEIKKFKTFKIICAGSTSPEVRSIVEYIRDVYGLTEREDADMKVHIVKTGGTWEVGVEVTPRPLFLRDYKVRNMAGAMDPTIAYAVNSLCELEKRKMYLNIFSGSATLLIEAAIRYPNLEHLIGFDNDKGVITLAIQNIKKAGLMKRIQIKGRDIFDMPSLGKFDAIVSDLPFGMLISKDEDLDKLYQCFVKYSQETLNPNGILVTYTSKHEILQKILKQSDFQIMKTLNLKISTALDRYIYPKIFVCRIK